MLIVLDTVRADHTSLCGYERPTTPALAALAARPGASFTCAAYAPGTWTLPSHASYFTGRDVPDHRASDAFVAVGRAREVGAVSVADIRLADVGGRWLAMPLAPEAETLAETFRARGWRTRLVSGNRLLGRELGLDQGFDKVVVAPHEAVAAKEAAEALGSDSAFLVVNIFDAHDPWPAVPPGLGWVPERPPLGYDLRAPNDAWRQYVTGGLTGPEREAFLGHLTDVYDAAVNRADDTLAAILAMADERGWPSRGLRLAVVSDHGEMLGEHGLLQHGQHVWETTQRVPLVLLDTTRPDPVPIPSGPVSATAVYAFLRDGTPPAAGPVVAHGLPMWWSAAFPGLSDGRWVARWEGSRKVTWHEGDVVAYDLAADPGELHPLPATAAERAAVEAEGERVRGITVATGDPDPATIEALRAAGYLE